MVLVAEPSPGSGASGSIRSDTYSHNRFGRYVRNRTKPVNPRSERQTVVRSALAQLSERWSTTLTQAQRDAWDLYGNSVVMKNAVGQDIYLTGYNHYIRSNVPIVQASLTIIDAGPVVFELPEQDPTFAITATESTQMIAFTFDNTMTWANEDGGWLLKYQGSPQNPQRTFFNGPWRYVGRIEGDAITPPTSPDSQAVQFAVATGQRQWCYGRILRADGRLSEPFRAEIIVVAGV